MLSVFAVVALMSTGCQTSVSGAGESDVVKSDRPMVQVTAAQAVSQASGNVASDDATLNFLDELESRPLAAQDDAVHATLLLGTGRSAATTTERIRAARQLGYLPESVANAPPQRAVTVGEVAMMISSVLERGEIAKMDRAMDVLVRYGVLSAALPTNQGLTGAQLVSIVASAQNAMRTNGIARADWPAMMPESASPATAREPVRPRYGNGRLGRTEPLPDVALGDAGPAVDLADPPRKPLLIGPGGEVMGDGLAPAGVSPTTPATPTNAPQANKPTALTPKPARSVWVSGGSSNEAKKADETTDASKPN